MSLAAIPPLRPGENIIDTNLGLRTEILAGEVDMAITVSTRVNDEHERDLCLSGDLAWYAGNFGIYGEAQHVFFVNTDTRFTLGSMVNIPLWLESESILVLEYQLLLDDPLASHLVFLSLNNIPITKKIDFSVLLFYIPECSSLAVQGNLTWNWIQGGQLWFGFDVAEAFSLSFGASFEF